MARIYQRRGATQLSVEQVLARVCDNKEDHQG